MEAVRHCAICGYDLRALPAHHPCPECGSADGRTEFDPLPWERSRSWHTYLSTLRMLVAEPDDVAMQLWSVTPLRLGSARRFRRINLTVATACLSAVAFVLTLAALTQSAVAHPLRAALCCLPVQVGSIIVGLNELTLFRLKGYQQQGVPRAESPHLRALMYYLSAGLAFAPVHLLLLPVSGWFVAGFGHPFMAVGMHALVLTLQLLLVVGADARLAEQLLDMSNSVSRISAVLTQTLSPVVFGGYLFVGPVFAAFVARHLVGG